MSTVIDERVVEMKFDNKQFEEGARESLGTLSKLKMALDKTDSSKAFEDLDRATQNIHLDGIASGVEALQKRFSVFGLVGIKAINGVADSLLSMTKRLYNVTIGQIVSGGIKRAMNMENARFQLQALFSKEKNSAELVEEIMKNANDAVDGTAYSLDAAAKAASQFAATGIKAGEEMTGALRGIVGVSAMTNSDFESISNIFTTVAGQGRVMGDQLNQLAARGLNAAATMADFANGVQDGSIKASDEVTALVKSFGTGAKITEGDIRSLVSKGKISFKMFSEAMTDAFADSAEKANETFSGALSNVKSALSRIGAEFISPLIAQNSKIVELFNALRLKINEFKKAIAFDEEVGNSMAVAKQFTDFVLKMAEALTIFINNIDTASIMRDFYYGLEIVKNIFKALWVLVKPALMATPGLIKPIGEAMHTVLVVLEAVTSRMIASESVSTALGEVLKEIVSIIGTLISGLLKLIQKVFKPLNKETKTTNNGFVDLLHTIANVLKGFNNWLKTSPLMNRAFNSLAKVIQTVVGLVGTLGKLFGGAIMFGFNFLTNGIKTLTDIASKSGIIESIVKGISSAFEKLSNVLSSFKIPGPIKNFTAMAKEYSESSDNITESVKEMSDGVSRLTSIGTKMAQFGATLKELFGYMSIGAGKVWGFVKQFANLDTLKKSISIFIDQGEKFLSFLIEAHDAIVGAAVGGSIAYGLVKIGKGIEALGSAFSGIGKIFNNFAGVLSQTQKAIKAYQRDLNANALLKVSAAILVLSGALVVLSHIDPERLLSAATALAMVSVVILGGVSVLSKAVIKTKNIYDVMDTLASQVGKAAKTKAIGSAIKDLGMSLMMIAGSIIAIAVMYKKDSAAMTESLKIVAAIGAVLLGFIATMTLLGKVMGGGMKSFSIAALGVAALAMSLTVVVVALNKLFKMKLPMDYKQKLDILYGILMALTTITAALTIVSNFGHGGHLTTMPIFLLFTSLHSIISAMQRLFKMSLPHDYEKKLGILNGIFVELSAVVMAMGVATRIAGGQIKSAGSILAMTAFLVAAVGSLAVLTIFPMDKLKSAVIALSGILISLGTALLLASTVVSGDTAKAIMNMAISIGVITAALSVLTLFEGKDLLTSATSIGLVLLAMGDVIKQAASISSDSDSILSIVGVAISVAALAAILYKLSEQDWKGMLASGAAMYLTLKAYAAAFTAIGEVDDLDFKMVGKFISATLAAIPLAAALYLISNKPWASMVSAGAALGITLKSYGQAFQVLGKVEDVDKDLITRFVEATLAAIPLAAALALLAFQPWEGILSAGAALSATLITYAKSFEILSKTGDVDMDKIKEFLLATLSVIPIGAALGLLAFQPWDNLIGAALALSATLIAFSGCFAIISKTAIPAEKMVAAFVGSSLALIPIAVALKIVAGEPWDELLGAAASLSLVLVALAGTMDICIIAGKFAKEAAIGIGLLMAFVAGLTVLVGVIGAVVDWLGAGDAITRGIEIIQQIGKGLGTAIGEFAGGILEGATENLTSVADNLSAFMDHLKPFTDGLQYITEDSIKGVMMLGQMVASLTGSELLQGVTKLIGGDANFEALGEQLNAMAPYLQTFSASVANISPESVEGAKVVSEIMLALSDSLPRIGGVMDSILGTKKTLTDFGMELASFGPSIKLFSQIVSGIDPSSVEGAAAAANIMSEVANNLPSTGGLIDKIFGSKSLSEFGAELVPFGIHIKTFAGMVKDVEASAVEGAANAGGVMARLADTLPNSGGLLEFFVGGNDIDDFGEMLVSFGESMVTFSQTVAGLNPETINGVATITEVMSELAESLPNTQSVFSIFTGGQMDFKKFGDQLEKFGKSLAKYSDSVAGVDLPLIETATTAINNIVSLLTSMIGIDPNAMSYFGLALGNLSSTAIQEFVIGFQNGDVLVINAVNQLFTNLVQTITEQSLIVTNTIRTNIDLIVFAMSVYLPVAFAPIKTTMVQIGHMVTDGLVLGLSEGIVNVRQAATEMANIVADATKTALDINSPSKLAQAIGGFWNQGLAQGLVQNMGIVKDAATNLAKNGIENTIRQKLEIHSPSKVGEYLGEMLPEGMANGIDKGSKKVEQSVSDLSSKAKSALGSGADVISEFIKDKADNDFLNTVNEVYGGIKKSISNDSKEVAEEVENGATEAVKATQTPKAKGIKQETNYWAELLKIKQAGIDGSKYKDMDLVKFQESVLTEATDLYKNYLDQLNSTTDSLYNTMSPLEAFEKKDAVSKENIKKNLNDQINAYGEFANLMANLNARTGDTKLGEYLRTLNVEDIEQLKVFNSMTDEELTEYVNLFDTKYQAAQTAATTQLYDLQKETEAGLADLFGGMKDAVNLFDFAETFNGTFESINSYVSGVMIPIQEANIKAAQEASKLGEEITDGVNMGMADGSFDDVVNTHMDTAFDLARDTQLDNAQDFGKEIGEYINKGAAEGMGKTSFVDASKDMMNNLLETLKTAGEIHSPSALTEREVGPYLTEGVAEGMKDAIPSVNDAIAEIVKSIISRFDENIESISESASGIASAIQNGIGSKKNSLISDVKGVGTSVISAMKSSMPDSKMKAIGINLMTVLINAIKSKKKLLIDTVKKICSDMMETFEEGLDDNKLKDLGLSCIIALNEGLNSNVEESISAARDVCEAVMKTFEDEMSPSKFRDIGQNAVDGLLNGSKNGEKEVEKETEKIANGSVNKAKQVLDEHSPSRVFYKIGKFIPMGLANGIKDYIGVVQNASNKMSEQSTNYIKDAVYKINDVINSDTFNDEITIKPIVDLSNVERSTKDIAKMFNTRVNASANVASATASFNTMKQGKTGAVSGNGSGEQVVNNYNFEQNNYSPEALSAVDIYRQTNNQLRFLKTQLG